MKSPEYKEKVNMQYQKETVKILLDISKALYLLKKKAKYILRFYFSQN